MRKGFCLVLAAVMVLAVGGCGGSAGQKTLGTDAEKTIPDAAELSSAGQEIPDTSALSSASGNALESSGPSLENQEDPGSSVLPPAGEMARDGLSDAETEGKEQETQIAVTVETPADETVSQEVEEETLIFPADMPSEFTFSSGAGGWSTDLRIQSNGYFSGTFLDSDLGTSDTDYPKGTVYYCNFGGELKVVEKMDEYSYAVKLAGLEKEKGKEYIEDGIRYVPSEPYGMEKGKNYILYLPDTPLDGLSEEFLMWWPGRYDAEERTTLGYYGLYNKDTEYGFFGDIE